MNPVFRALAMLALTIPAAANAAPKATPEKPARSDIQPALLPSAAATRVAEWVAASNDNHALPYAIIDKNNAALFLFDGKGKPLDAVPVLIGIAVGDEATPGVGSKKLAEIGPAEKTTPAGRYLAKFGVPFGKERILWVDYATSVAIHPIPVDINKKERRRQRMLSPTPDDNRITFGCINVPKVFYGQRLRPLFQKKGGYVYVLPDIKRIEDVFPRLQAQPVVTASVKE